MRILALSIAFLGFWSCGVDYTEVAVVNKTGPGTVLRNLSFNGCLWNTVLAYEETSTPDRCLKGEGRIYFEKFDASAYSNTPTTEAPLWFRYQTTSTRSVKYGEFRVFEITNEDMEQDFSVPGPYGH